MKYMILGPAFLISAALLGQTPEPDYEKLKASMVAQFQNTPPGKVGPFVKGVAQRIDTNEKILALTFDACGGPHGNDYDKELIGWLRREKIQATLFIGGVWVHEPPHRIYEFSACDLFLT